MKIKIAMSLIGLSLLISACGTNGDTSTKTDTTIEDNKDISTEEAEMGSKEEGTVESEEQKLEDVKEDEAEGVKEEDLEEVKEGRSDEKAEKEGEEDIEEDESKTESEEESELTAAELEEILLQQPCYVERIDYIDGDNGADVSVVVKNNSGTDIKNVFYAMAGWDSNNLPLILRTYKRVDGTGYVVETDFGDANIVDGGTYGEDLLFGIMEETASRLETFKAVVVKYEDFEGNIWENPYYSDWIEIYKEKKLEP